MRSANEIASDFSDHVGFLRSSCQRFDEGISAEAKRIAATIYIMLHDPMQRGKQRKSQSLLMQMGVKTALPFVSYAKEDPPGNLMDWHPLVSLGFVSGSKPTFVPNFHSPVVSNDLSFSKWWEADVIRMKRPIASLTRKKLVMTMRDQDGGGHYDEAITDSLYRDLVAGKVSPWNYEDEHGTLRPLPPVIHLISVRMIAHELLGTLRNARLI